MHAYSRSDRADHTEEGTTEAAWWDEGRWTRDGGERRALKFARHPIFSFLSPPPFYPIFLALSLIFLSLPVFSLLAVTSIFPFIIVNFLLFLLSERLLLFRFESRRVVHVFCFFLVSSFDFLFPRTRFMMRNRKRLNLNKVSTWMKWRIHS